MKGFIFAAGFGTRMHPLTKDIPKPLLPLFNIPSILFPLALLQEAGVTQVVINIHHLKEKIKKFFTEQKLGIEVVFSEEKEILGTGGGLKNAEKLLGPNDFFLINSDILIDIDLRELEIFFQKNRRKSLLVLKKAAAARKIGWVSVIDDKIIDFADLLRTQTFSPYIFSGLSLLNHEILSQLEANFSSIVNTAFIRQIRQSALLPFYQEGSWSDIGTLESYWDNQINQYHLWLLLLRRVERILSVKAELPRTWSDPNRDIIVENSIVTDVKNLPAGSRINNTIIISQDKEMFSDDDRDDRKNKNQKIHSSSLNLENCIFYQGEIIFQKTQASDSL